MRTASIRRAAALLAWGASFARVVVAHAEPSSVVALDCPSLPPEPHAAVLSRAQAELVARGDAGTLVIACSIDSADLTWHPLVGESSGSTVQISPDPRATAEALLDALDELLSGTPPPAAPAVVVAPQWSSLGTRTLGSGEPGRTVVRGGVAAGAAFEAWSKTEVLGPSARVELLLPAKLELEAGAAAGWGLAAPASVSARLVRLGAGAEYAFDEPRRFRIGANALLDFLHVTPGATTGTSTASGTGYAVGLRATYAFSLTDTFRLVVGPDATVRPRPLRVELGARELFQVPVFAVGASVDVELVPF